MESVSRVWTELSDMPMEMCLFLLVVCFCVNLAKPDCQEKILQQLVGYRCITAIEVYDQTLNTRSRLCRHQCISRDGCSVANYDVALGTCLVTQEKCIDVVTDLSFELTYFRSITKDECLRWVPISEFDINKAVTSEHCSYIPEHSKCHVGRLLSPSNILPDKFQPALPVRIGEIWTVLNGVHANSAYQDDTGEVLQVHSECNVFWKPFNDLMIRCRSMP